MEASNKTNTKADIKADTKPTIHLPSTYAGADSLFEEIFFQRSLSGDVVRQTLLDTINSFDVFNTATITSNMLDEMLVKLDKVSEVMYLMCISDNDLIIDENLSRKNDFSEYVCSMYNSIIETSCRTFDTAFSKVSEIQKVNQRWEYLMIIDYTSSSKRLTLYNVDLINRYTLYVSGDTTYDSVKEINVLNRMIVREFYKRLINERYEILEIKSVSND